MSLQQEQQFFEMGKKLENPPQSKDALLKILKQAATVLSEVDQSPSDSMLKAMQPSMQALVTEEIMRHRDRDVRLLVATCISEITRITAPDAPYSDDVLREIFQLIVASFQGLDEIHSSSFGRRVTILETVAKVRSCVVMLDLECDDLILEMFQIFFSTASISHPENVLTSMQTIMALVLDESEDISEQLLAVLLTNLSTEKRDISPAGYRLAMNVVECCAAKLEPYVNHFLTSAMSAQRSSQNNLQIDCHEVIYNIYQCAPQMLQLIIPILTEELLTDQLDVRLKAVKLLGRLFAFPHHLLAKEFQPLFSEFLKRFTDKSVAVRLLVVEYAKECLLANPLRPDASDIIASLSDRLLDYEENVRRQVVAAICDVATYALKCMPIETVRQVADRLRDTTVSVRKYTLERLAEVYRVYCSKCSDGLISGFEFDWIPGKILRCCYDKDFRVQAVEVVFTEALFPSELSLAERVKHWIAMFSECEKIEVKAFEKLLSQKQRLQLEMQGFLSLRQKMKEDDTPDLQNQFLSCFKTMSGFFKDPELAEESFQKLNRMKDSNIWKALSSLVDPSLTLLQAQATRDDLLKRLGDKHPQYEFMKIVAIKCSHLLFGKEHVKAMLREIAANKLAGKDDIVLSGMNLLVLVAGYFPSLVEGAEEDLLQLLKEENDQIKEGVVHILAKAGGSIREQTTETSGSVDLLLEKLCLEGSRKQAKYAVQAIAAITKDSGHKALSLLYKKLVDMLESGSHLSTILQSLGCIAQIAMPVFETREDDVIQFVCRKLLRQSSNPADVSRTEWDERSEECFLKICGIKTLVKSYLPNKEAHLRQRIKALFGVLTKLITSGEISEDVKSSKVDKAHLRLAAGKAVLRLSRRWDSHITPQLLHLTLRIVQDDCPHVRSEFLSKVHQYLKERTLNHKYACAFVLGIPGVTEHDHAEARQHLIDFIETCHRETQLRQPWGQFNGVPLIDSAENILIYLVHVLAHHPEFPASGENLCAEALEPFYWQLHFFLSVMLHQDEERHCNPGKTGGVCNIPLIMTIFRTIKQMEDAVDKSKSENLYALCDIGLMITKDLVHHMDNSGDSMRTIPLPGLFYRPLEGSEGNQLKVDGSHFPACLAGNAVLRNLTGANVCGGTQLNLVQKWSKRCADENAPEEGDKGATKVHSSKKIRNKKTQRKVKESICGGPTIPETFKPQLDTKVGTFKKSGVVEGNELLNPKKLEYGRPLELIEEQREDQTTEVMLKQYKVAEDNVTGSVVGALVPRKRKVGRPSKVTMGLAPPVLKRDHSGKDFEGMESSRPKRGYPKSSVKMSDVKEETKLPDFKMGTTERVLGDLAGKPLMSFNDQLLEASKFSAEKLSKHSKKKEVEASNEAKKQRKRKTSDILPKQLIVSEDNKICSNAETLVSAKRRRGRPSKEKSDVASSGQKQGLSQGVLAELELSQRKRGRPKGSGKKLDIKGKIQLPDLTTVVNQKISDGLSGATLSPSNCQPFEENKYSVQKSSNHSKRLDVGHDKVSKTLEKTPLKPGDFPESAEMRLCEDGTSRKETLRKPLKKKSISGLEKSPGKLEMEDEEGKRLVGHRIKVWWPLDEQFYVGVVESYDSKQRKHKIIYDDGDIEVLRLQREQWELIDASSVVDQIMTSSIASPRFDGDTRTKRRLKTHEPSVMKEGKIESPRRRGTSLSKMKNRTMPKSGGNPDDNDLSTRRFNSNSFRTKASAGAAGDPFVFIDDSEQSAHSKRARQTKQGSEGKKGRQRTASAKRTHTVVEDSKTTRETGKTADGKKQDTLCDRKDSDDEPLNAWKFRRSKVR